VHVPYKGGAPAITDLIGGQVQLLFVSIPSVLPHVRAGRLRAIAVSSARRSASAPDVPTVAESGYPGFEALNWFGVVVRAGPRPAIERLNADIVRAMELPEVKDQMARQGMQPATMSPDAYDAFLRAEAQRNERIIKSLKLKIE